ncbi:MAG: nucleotidyltransferase family protein, partial [Chromatocurvus sp.]
VCLREGDRVFPDALSGSHVTTMICRHAHDGMGATLAEAVSGISGWDALLVALADMPLVKASTYQALAQACSRELMVVPRYRGRRGNPVCFGADWFHQLRRCSGDRGARAVLSANPQAVRALGVDDAGILWDVDRPTDLDAMR